VKAFLAEKLASGLARNSVRIIHATLRAMLNAAVDDGLILGHPADRLGRRLRLVQRPAERRETIKALTREQLAHFLATAAATDPRHAPPVPLDGPDRTSAWRGARLQWKTSTSAVALSA
jgi:hypothetical protein